MNKSILLLTVLAVCITFSCSSKRDTGSMDMENWKSDHYGCKSLRMQDLEELTRLKNSFLGADNQAIIKTFGRPDRVELVDKSQTFFFYFLEPSSMCDGVEIEKEPLRILFRLNAVSKVSEVTITTQNP
ncbi:hypothetical protein [Algoriphagus sp.]|uniref:hypothetical protein n=1 Tax=Algoriphagus sp. TaxID=1872435 RepID=UPI003273F052